MAAAAAGRAGTADGAGYRRRVAFTADPVTGERGCVVIDAITGIGDRLVSGAVTPDRWVIRGDDAPGVWGRTGH